MSTAFVGEELPTRQCMLCTRVAEICEPCHEKMLHDSDLETIAEARADVTEYKRAIWKALRRWVSDRHAFGYLDRATAEKLHGAIDDADEELE